MKLINFIKRHIIVITLGVLVVYSFYYNLR
jgi:hypothetical protein